MDGYSALYKNVTNITDAAYKNSLDDRYIDISLSVCVILILLIIPGNISIIIYMWKTKKFSSNFSIYATSLAIADCSVGIIGLPVNIVMTSHPELFRNGPLCISVKIFDYALGSISLLLLDAIAYDRYRCVTSPLLYRTKFTRRRSLIICISLWILGFAVWIPYFVGQQFHDVYKSTSSGCSPMFGYFTLGQSTLAYYLPVLFLVLVYILLWCALKKRTIIAEPKQKKGQTVYTVANEVGQNIIAGYDIECNAKCKRSAEFGLTAQSERVSQRETFSIEVNPNIEIHRETARLSMQTRPSLRLTLQSTHFGEAPKISSQNKQCFKTMGLIIIVFLLCWAPFCITWSIRGICQWCVPYSAYLISFLLAYTNSAFNPFIYLLTSKTMRSELVNWVRRRLVKSPVS